MIRRVLGGREDRGGKGWGNITIYLFYFPLKPGLGGQGDRRERKCVFLSCFFLSQTDP